MKKEIDIFIRGAVAALVLAAATLLGSCVREPFTERGGTDGKTVVTLSFKVPASAPAVRSLDEATDEIAVKTVEVLVFDKDGKYCYMSRGKVNSDGTQADVELIQSDENDPTDKYDLVVLANSYLIVIALNPSKDDSKAAVLAGLEKSLGTADTNKWPSTAATHPGFPMSSDPDDTGLKDRVIGENLSISGIKLFRMVARVNVVVGAGAADFELTSVRVYNRNTTGKLIPVMTGTGGSTADYTLNPKLSREKGPLLYDGSEITKDVGGKGVSCEREIYLFEVDNNASGLDLLTRPCIVVGGYYKNDTKQTYYRLDFSQSATTWLDIKRNHSYNFTITAVSGAGLGDPGTAFESTPADMTFGVEEWNDGNIGNVVIGNYELGVNRKLFNIPVIGIKDENDDNRLIVSTTYTDSWTVSVMDGNSVATSGWLKVKCGSETGYSIESGVAGQQNFYLQSDANTTVADRTATIRVTAGRLTQIITVVLSATPTANSYIINANAQQQELLIPVSQAVKGIAVVNATPNNSTTLTFDPASEWTAGVLWQTWRATAVTNQLVVSNNNDGNIRVGIPAGVTNGNNAIIALYDTGGKIVWSWHLWITDYAPAKTGGTATNGQLHQYASVAFTTGIYAGKYIMDRNLGVTWTGGTPFPQTDGAEAAKAYGLLYQWGRKDPFTPANGLSRTDPEAITIYDGAIDGYTLYEGTPTGINKVRVDANIMNNLSNAVQNPMIYYFGGYQGDWYSGSSSSFQNNNLWGPRDKSVFDPCPLGYRVPYGGETPSNNPWAGFANANWNSTDGVSSGASNGSPSWFPWHYNATTGVSTLGTTAGRLYTYAGVTAWFPAAGYLNPGSQILSNVGQYGYCWSAATTSVSGSSLYINQSFIYPVQGSTRAAGFPVRCIQE